VSQAFLGTARARGAQSWVRHLFLTVPAQIKDTAGGRSLVTCIQQEVRAVKAAAVGHHHCPDGAGVEILDLEEPLHHVDIL
jgi:hypothetical protein